MANEKRKVIRKSNIVDFLSVIRRYNENWSSCCCSCRVLNSAHTEYHSVLQKRTKGEIAGAYFRGAGSGQRRTGPF